MAFCLSTGFALCQVAPVPRNTARGVAYVGSQACGGCHPEILESFQKTGMGRSMAVPGAAPFLATLRRKERRLSNAKLGRTFEVINRDDGLYQSESRIDADRLVFQTSYRLEYAIGSGAHGVSFIVRRGGNLFQAPLSLYAQTGDWDLSPGYEQADYGFNRPIASACLACHSGGPQPITGRNGAYRDPPFRELAIGCENCHGPGELHVKERTRGPAHGADSSIVNPRRLSARLAENICMNCHQTGDARVLQPGKEFADFRPGTWLSDTLAIFNVRTAADDSDLLEHHSAMSRSRCFVASKGKLSCMTCHNPHAAVDASNRAAYYRARCLNCHTDASCRLTAPARGPDNDCSGCHMPKRETAVISHTALTNHRIVVDGDRRIRTPAAQKPPLEPELEYVNASPGRAGGIPPILMLEAYGEVLDRHPEFRSRYAALLDQLSRSMPGNARVQSALGRKFLYDGPTEAGNRQALEHFEKAIALGSGTADVQRDLAEALARLNRLSESVEHLKIALELEPYDPLLHKTLALRLIALKNYPLALEEMRRYVELFPEDDFMRDLLVKATVAK